MDCSKAHLDTFLATILMPELHGIKDLIKIICFYVRGHLLLAITSDGKIISNDTSGRDKHLCNDWSDDEWSELSVTVDYESHGHFVGCVFGNHLLISRGGGMYTDIFVSLANLNTKTIKNYKDSSREDYIRDISYIPWTNELIKMTVNVISKTSVDKLIIKPEQSCWVTQCCLSEPQPVYSLFGIDPENQRVYIFMQMGLGAYRVAEYLEFPDGIRPTTVNISNLQLRQSFSICTVTYIPQWHGFAVFGHWCLKELLYFIPNQNCDKEIIMDIMSPDFRDLVLINNHLVTRDSLGFLFKLDLGQSTSPSELLASFDKSSSPLSYWNPIEVPVPCVSLFQWP